MASKHLKKKLNTLTSNVVRVMIFLLSVESLAGVQESDDLVYKICPNITLSSADEITFTVTERALICDKASPGAWSEIPVNQKEYFLRRFLEAKGYFFPTITYQGEEMLVVTDLLAISRSIEIQDSPIAIDPTVNWTLYGKPLTPGLLDSLERWVQKHLSESGYPCAMLVTRAYPITGLITIRVEKARKAIFPPIKTEPISNLIGGIETRYFVFDPGEAYNSMLLELSSRRMVQDGIVVSSNFMPRCSEDGELEEIKQHNIPGDPRLISFGIGFDTEEYLILEVGWKNSRWTSSASTLEAYTRSSYRQQRLVFSHLWYYAPIVTRHYIRSMLEFVREREPRYTASLMEARSGPAWSFDRGNNYYLFWLAPSMRQTLETTGPRPSGTKALGLNIDLKITSHEFEYFLPDPRSGYNLGVRLSSSNKSLGADYSATSYAMDGTSLFNLFRLDPPIWVLGLRARLAATVLSPDTTIDEIPPLLRVWLGGSADLRGFGRKKIPDEGALTALYLGAETRINNALPYGLQPIAFFDWGRVGPNELTLSPQSYWSPGLGLHWQSIIGLIRATVARGYVSGPEREAYKSLEQWQLYLSYGEQF